MSDQTIDSKPEPGCAAVPGSPWAMRIVEMLDYALDEKCAGAMIEVNVHGADWDEEMDEWSGMDQLDGCEFSTTCEHGDIQITWEELRQLRNLLSGNDEVCQPEGETK